MSRHAALAGRRLLKNARLNNGLWPGVTARFPPELSCKRDCNFQHLETYSNAHSYFCTERSAEAN